MGVLQFPVAIPATNGNLPSLRFMISTDNLATVTSPGYLNSSNAESAAPLSNNDVIMALYGYNTQITTGTFSIFTVGMNSNTGVTLAEWTSPGNAVLPTTPGYFASFSNSTGTVTSAPGSATQPGNISAGLSGVSGSVSSFPAAANTGSLVLAAVPNTGNTTTTISNEAMGQASVISIPDPGAATATFLLNTSSGGQHISGDLTISGNITTEAGDINASEGDVIAGSNGNAGKVVSFPPTANSGSFEFTAVSNAGNTVTTISNSSMGQASVISIPDPGAPTADFILSTSIGGQIIDEDIIIDNGNLEVTTGDITADAGTISALAGNVIAGSSGNAGILSSFPSSPNTGSLNLSAVANAGNTTTTISNASMAQQSVISIPDPGTANANFALVPSSLTNGNLVSASGTSGLLQNAGISASSVMTVSGLNQMTGFGLIALVKGDGTESGGTLSADGQAGLITTSSLSIGPGTSYVINWNNAFLFTNSAIVLTLAGGTNTNTDIQLYCVTVSGSNASLTIYNNSATDPLNGTIEITYIVM